MSACLTYDDEGALMIMVNGHRAARLGRRTECNRCGRLFRNGDSVLVTFGDAFDTATWVHAPTCPAPRRRWWQWWLR